MISRYVYGTPIETEAVLHKPEAEKGEVKGLQREGSSLFCSLSDEDIVYGLGENVRGINKRGWIYQSNCTDEPNHREDKISLYGAHNFIVVSGKRHFGLFIDTPGIVTFDIGYSNYSVMKITLEVMDCEIYRIDGDSPHDIVRQFRRLTGPCYLPPKWAFGYGQSRWSYQTSQEVREVVAGHRENGIALDAIYLDIDYMERYKDFTIDRERFSDFEELVEEMKEQEIHLVPIIDAGVKIEPGYEVYEEGIAKGFFCKDENDEELAVGVWPGKCHFPDMLNDEARTWFGRKYQFLLDKGIDGFWNDMNEPAIFYSEKRLKEVFEKLAEYREKNLDVNTFFDFQNLVSAMANNPQDYRSFYHNYHGQRIRHDQVHNLFGYYMTRSAGEAFEELEPDKRILMFSRASYIGMHRYGGIWMGDNLSWWSHIVLNLKMLPSLNMCGFLYVGADIGGFGADTTEDLMLRWLALGIFMPLMRNHSAKGTRRQEAYSFEQKEAFRDLIGLRYRLLPYLYSEFMKAALSGDMYCRPLGFVWPEDEQARHVEDQLLIGESIMIAPVYEQNAIGRYVYLPEDVKLLRFQGQQVVEEKEMQAGSYFINVRINEVVVFLLKDHILPLSEGGQRVGQVSWDNLKLYHYGAAAACYELYDDDGISRSVSLQEHIKELWI